MNGAESLVRTLISCGVDTCFANPGTSEIHFVAALDRIPGMHCVLALFEGVVTGAADGYGRMARKPAATLMHCGPGLANGFAYLHNAKRAGTPIVNIVGDQATYHAPLNPPLASDVEGWARQVSQWVRKAKTANEVGASAAEAVQKRTARAGRQRYPDPALGCELGRAGRRGGAASCTTTGKSHDRNKSRKLHARSAPAKPLSCWFQAPRFCTENLRCRPSDRQRQPVHD